MKKLLAIAMMVCLLFTLAIMPAQAAEVPAPDAELMALYYRNAGATLSISASGNATCTGKIEGIEGTTTSCSISLYLQRYENGDWEDVAMWTDSANVVSLTLTRPLGADSGYKYRTKAVCYAYSGSQMEYTTRYSSEVWY
ncbi:MAG: hypothetical protein E7299_03420 [Lachnospiraceae bacterium]|nr:hypothetical protein [Lachnospiraceae bacterium]